jgi:nucleoid-associated protein YgaU
LQMRETQSPSLPLEFLPAPPTPPQASPGGEMRIHEVTAGERLDEIVQRYYGDDGHPALWRFLAAYNGIDDPLHIPPGSLLHIPPPSLMGRTS